MNLIEHGKANLWTAHHPHKHIADIQKSVVAVIDLF